jgi:lysophospholipase L1-like esterase
MRSGRRRRVLRAALVAATLLSTLLGLVAVELLGRRWLRGLGDPASGPPAPSMLAVPFEPYLMFGEQYGWLEERGHDGMLASEGPAAFGYRPEGGTYLYGFDARVDDIADRGAFLFDEQPLADDPDAEPLRIFVVGASVARGVGASSPYRAWHALLARQLSEALGRQVVFVSAAVDAYVSTQEQLVMRLMVLPRCPDAVVIFDGWNDAAMPAMFGVRPGDPVTQGLLYQHFYAPLSGLVQAVARQSAVLRYLSYRRMLTALDANRRRIAARPGGVARYGEDTAAVYVDNVTRMLATCRRMGLPCAAFLQPARSQQRATPDPASPWAVQETLERASYDAIRARLAERRPPGMHDLSGVFDPAQDWFVDPVHFGDHGQAVVAQAMLPIVLEALGGELRRPGVQRCAG